jgi:hypothetical protein
MFIQQPAQVSVIDPPAPALPSPDLSRARGGHESVTPAETAQTATPWRAVQAGGVGDAEQEPFLLAPVSAKTVSDAIEKGWTAFFSQGCYGRHRVSAAGTPAHDPSHVASKFTEGDLASLVAPDASRNPLTGVSSGCIGGSQRWRVFTTPRGWKSDVGLADCRLVHYLVHSNIFYRAPGAQEVDAPKKLPQPALCRVQTDI